ncbi:MAG: chromosomal replication initiator protein DnaA [Candidatus Moranbacteria bacterium]|nr:chromosomal replication initiator protein DnaA [Candidatus Moranbacteria bacterium]
MDQQELWKSSLGQIELSISKANFVTWFQNTGIIAIEDGIVTISVPNGFAKEWLENKYNHTILQSLRSFDESIKGMRCVISGPVPPGRRNLDAAQAKQSETTIAQVTHPTHKSTFSGRIDTIAVNTPQKTTALFHESNLNDRYQFESFVVAENNELAHAACYAISQNLARVYNPLFIYGGVGLGKTHLLQALGNEVKRRDPKNTIKYITSERFTSELVDSIKNQTIDKFKEYYQQMDLLIIDDIQFLSGREKTQNEFFHIFNGLYQLNKQIVISSDRPPKSIQTLEDRLRSRFEGGMIVDISQPNLETRTAILERKVREKGIDIESEVIRFIAEHITQNVRELEGALNRISAYADFYKLPPDLKLVEKALAQIIIQGKKEIKTEDILSAILNKYSVTDEDLKKKGRKKGISHPRQIAMYLMRSELNMPFSAIGDFFGGRDHTTALHAFEKIGKDIEINLRLKGEISDLKDVLYRQNGV